MNRESQENFFKTLIFISGSIKKASESLGIDYKKFINLKTCRTKHIPKDIFLKGIEIIENDNFDINNLKGERIDLNEIRKEYLPKLTSRERKKLGKKAFRAYKEKVEKVYGDKWKDILIESAKKGRETMLKKYGSLENFAKAGREMNKLLYGENFNEMLAYYNRYGTKFSENLGIEEKDMG